MFKKLKKSNNKTTKPKSVNDSEIIMKSFNNFMRTLFDKIDYNIKYDI